MLGRDADAGISLRETIPKLPDHVGSHVSDLNLQNKVTFANVIALKQSMPQLEVPEMAGTEITGKAAPALAECPTVVQSLCMFTLSENLLKDAAAGINGKTLKNNRRCSSCSLVHAACVNNNPGFMQLNLNGKFHLKDCKNSLGVLGSLDEKEANGNTEVDDGEDDEYGLDSTANPDV